MRIKTFLFILGLIALLDTKPLVSEKDGRETVELTSVMYHSVLRDPARTGEYVVTPSQLETDLEYFRDNGYKTVTPEEITDFCRNGALLPEKPLLLTFDDGHLNNLTYVLPLLEKYGMTAEINLVGAFTLQAEKENDPNPAYAYLTREDAARLEKSGRFSLGCHTYNMHSLNGRNGASRNVSESPEEYRKAFSEDIRKWKELFGEGHRVYAYPFGFMSEDGFDILKNEGFGIILTCQEQKTALSSGREDDAVFIGRYNRSGLVTTEQFMCSNNI